MVEDVGDRSSGRYLQQLLTAVEYVFEDAEQKNANPHIF
jgi:hypothetical protein